MIELAILSVLVGLSSPVLVGHSLCFGWCFFSMIELAILSVLFGLSSLSFSTPSLYFSWPFSLFYFAFLH